jgi:hypothetical protein
MIPNPMTEGLAHVRRQLNGLKFEGALLLPGALTVVVLLIIAALFVVLWPYGLIAVMEDLVRGIMAKTRREMQRLSLVAKTPFVVAIGLYFVVWLPFAILCLPFVIVGAIGELFAE